MSNQPRKRPGDNARNNDKRASAGTSSTPGVAVYHVVYANEGFDDAAEMLFQTVRKAVQTWPGKPRNLFLDIEGHRNRRGGFDHDMLELQRNFVLGYLGRWLSEINMPLASVTRSDQHDDIPDHLMIQAAELDRQSTLRSALETGLEVYDADTDSRLASPRPNDCGGGNGA